MNMEDVCETGPTVYSPNLSSTSEMTIIDNS